MGDLGFARDSIGTYADEELSGWADARASDRTLDGAVHEATRARFLRLAIGPSFGAAVERGLAAADVEAALSLAAAWVVDERELEAKRLALRDHASTPGSDLVGAMVRTALRHDEARLGIAPSPTRASTVGPTARGRAADRPGRRREVVAGKGSTVRQGPAREPSR